MDKIQNPNVCADGPIAIRDQFDRFFVEVLGWLNDPLSADERLLRWLQGFGVPAEVYGGKPAEWLYRALQGPNRASLREKMAARLSGLLCTKPDVHPVGSLPHDLLENLFALAALLEEYEILAAPLLAVFRRHEKDAGPLMSDLGVRVAFRQALTHNQNNHELHDVWLDLIRQRQVSPIAGDEFAGLDGLLFAPLHIPNEWLVGIGQGMSELIKTVAGDNRRRCIVRRSFQVVRDSFPDEDRILERLIVLAHEQHYPRWAVECLPKLWFRFGFSKNGRPLVYLWNQISDSIPPEYSYERTGEYCGGLIICVELGSEAFSYVEQYAPEFEKRRLSNPSGTDHSMDVGIAHLLGELRQDALEHGSLPEATMLQIRYQRARVALNLPA